MQAVRVFLVKKEQVGIHVREEKERDGCGTRREGMDDQARDGWMT